MNSVICPNCGASIYENEAKCPFCGYINMTGAEEKFMRDMKKTEEELTQIPELQRAEYKKQISKNSKLIFITIGIAATVAAVLFGLYLFMENVLYSYDEGDAKAQMLWANETFPVLDEMYAAGDYEGLVEFQDQLWDDNYKNGTDFDMYEWEHYYFISAYRRYMDFERYMGYLDAGEELTKYEYENIVYYGMFFHYREYDNPDSYQTYTEEEIVFLDEKREWIEECMFGRLGFTQQETDDLYQEALGEFGIESEVCYKYAKKVKDRFQ